MGNSRLNNPSYLVGHWRLNSNADDYSGYANNCTWTGTEDYDEDENGKTVVPKIYEWYLKGELFEDGEDTVFLKGTLEIGTYWLDLIVGTDEVLSSEQVEFVVEK